MAGDGCRRVQSRHSCAEQGENCWSLQPCRQERQVPMLMGWDRAVPTSIPASSLWLLGDAGSTQPLLSLGSFLQGWGDQAVTADVPVGCGRSHTVWPYYLNWLPEFFLSLDGKCRQVCSAQTACHGLELHQLRGFCSFAPVMSGLRSFRKPFPLPTRFQSRGGSFA